MKLDPVAAATIRSCGASPRPRSASRARAAAGRRRRSTATTSTSRPRRAASWRSSVDRPDRVGGADQRADDRLAGGRGRHASAGRLLRAPLRVGRVRPDRAAAAELGAEPRRLHRVDAGRVARLDLRRHARGVHLRHRRRGYARSRPVSDPRRRPSRRPPARRRRRAPRPSSAAHRRPGQVAERLRVGGHQDAAATTSTTTAATGNATARTLRFRIPSAASPMRMPATRPPTWARQSMNLIENESTRLIAINGRHRPHARRVERLGAPPPAVGEERAEQSRRSRRTRRHRAR